MKKMVRQPAPAPFGLFPDAASSFGIDPYRHENPVAGRGIPYETYHPNYLGVQTNARKVQNTRKR